MVVSAKILSLAGAATLLSTAALAADLPAPDYGPPAMVDVGAYYLRGNGGVGIQQFRGFNFSPTTILPWLTAWNVDQKGINDTLFVGFGFGYQWNNWLRIDFTADYRPQAKFHAGATSFNGINTGGRDLFNGNHSAIVALANVYYDLGTWWCLTPFVGLGIGGAYHKIDSFTDLASNVDGLGASGLRFASSDRVQWTFAWAVHAGLAYSVTNNLKLEFAYRYLNLGNPQTPEIDCTPAVCGTIFTRRAFYTLATFDSHDFMIGLRWMLQQEPAPPPVIRKG